MKISFLLFLILYFVPDKADKKFLFGEEIGLKELGQTEFFDISDFKITNVRMSLLNIADFNA